MHRERLATIVGLLGVAVLVQCTPSPSPSPPPQPRPEGRLRFMPDFGTFSEVVPEATIGAVSLPRPYQKRLDTALALNGTCTGCHAEESAEWEHSLHHHAYDNAAFQTALAVEPTPFCRGCHAPEADPQRVTVAVGALGVGCVSCHVVGDGVVLAAVGASDRPSAAPHRVQRSRAFGETGGCAGCHEFSFPGAPAATANDADLMQTTVREHARTSAAGVACASCHMPAVAGRRSHTFAEVRDPAWLRDRLVVKAETTGDKLKVTLQQPAPGHAFPTGDLFRRLEVGLEERDPTGKVLRRETAHLTRHFQSLPGRTERQLTLDDRVFEGPRIVELPIRKRTGRLTWWVSYQRVAGIGTGADSTQAKIESEVSLHSGVLSWETK